MKYFFVITLACCFSLQAMPFNRRNMQLQSQPAAAPAIEPMKDCSPGSLERSMYDITTPEVRHAVALYGRQPVWTIKFCDNFTGPIGDVRHANELLRQQYGCGEDLSPLNRTLSGFLKLEYADFRIICSRYESLRKIIIHKISHRSNVYDSRSAFVGDHTNCLRELI